MFFISNFENNQILRQIFSYSIQKLENNLLFHQIYSFYLQIWKRTSFNSALFLFRSMKSFSYFWFCHFFRKMNDFISEFIFFNWKYESMLILIQMLMLFIGVSDRNMKISLFYFRFCISLFRNMKISIFHFRFWYFYF